MKTKVKLSSFTIFVLLVFSFASNITATENYVGVNQGDEFYWDVIIDDSLSTILLASPTTANGNHDSGSALVVSPGTYTDHVVNSSHANWYKVWVEEGNCLMVTLTFTHANGDINTELYDPSLSEIDSYSSTSNSEYLEAVASTTGYYYIEVYLWSGSSNTYSMQIAIDSECSGGPSPYEWLSEYFDVVAMKLVITSIEGGQVNPSGAKVFFSLSLAYSTNPNSFQAISEIPSGAYLAIIDPSTPNFYNYGYMWGGLGLIIPMGINWGSAASAFQSMLPSGATCNSLGNGLTLYYPNSITGIGNLEIALTYTGQGVLETATATLAGVIVVQITLQGLIPGYEILILLGASLASCIGLIVLYKRKSHL